MERVVWLDLVRRPLIDTSVDFARNKVIRDVEKEIEALENSQRNSEFVRTLKKLITPHRYTKQIKEAKAEILGSAESKKIATFLEKFIQELTTEERYFFRILS